MVQIKCSILPSFRVQVSGQIQTQLTLDSTILVQDKTKYAVSGTANLTIVNVQTTDEGLYQCTVGATTKDAYLQTVGT